MKTITAIKPGKAAGVLVLTAIIPLMAATAACDTPRIDTHGTTRASVSSIQAGEQGRSRGKTALIVIAGSMLAVCGPVIAVKAHRLSKREDVA